MARVKIDAGGSTFLPLCTVCGWRGMPSTSRGEAHGQAVHHEARAHPGEHHALKAQHIYRRRHAD